MTLREVLTTISEEMFIDRNNWSSHNERSVVSGKKILGFPTDRVKILVSKNGTMFDIVKIGDGIYEFYVGNSKETKNAPYKYKKCYIGTCKFDDFSDYTGVALGLIKNFINNSKISSEAREYLRDFYNEKRKYPYYKGFFEELWHLRKQSNWMRSWN